MAESMGYEWSSWRKYPRVIPTQENPVTVKVLDEGVPAVTEVRDISEGGVELELAEPLAADKVDRKLTLEVSLPEPVNATLTTSGRIRHAAEQAVGLRFVELAAEDRQRLRRYVQHRTRSESWLTRLRRSWWGNF